LYLYSPLLDGLPKDDKIKLRLYEKLLEGSLLGGQMAGGAAGVAVNEELILVHATIDMEHALGSALRAYAPIFVEMVEKWRKHCLDFSEGRFDEAPSAEKAPTVATSGGAQGQGFIKI